MIVTNLSPINQLKCVKRGSQVEYSYSDTNWWNKINSSIFNQRDKIWSFLEHQESSPTDGIEAKTGDDLNFAVEHFWILNTGCGREELEMTLQIWVSLIPRNGSLYFSFVQLLPRIHVYKLLVPLDQIAWQAFLEFRNKFHLLQQTGADDWCEVVVCQVLSTKW